MSGGDVISEDRPARGHSVRGASALDNLPSAARTTGERAAARSRLVRRLRIALPVLALILILAFFFNTRSNHVDDAFLKDFEQLTATTEDLRMASPRFAGVDDRGRPFEITADAAIQKNENRDLVTLEQPRAVQGDQGDETVVTAEKGVYRSEENILELEDEVTLEHQFGKETYVLRSPSATVSIKDEVVESTAGVGGQSSDGGALRADEMRAYRSEGRVIFEGNVSMRIFPKSAGENAGDDKQSKESDAQDAASSEQNDAEIDNPK